MRSRRGTEPVECRDEAKPGGGVRRIATLGELDGPEWDRLAGRVAPHVEAALRVGVVGNRAEVRADGWRLRPLAPALRGARSAAAAIAGRAPLVILTDVAAFYPSVTPSVAHRALVRCGAPREEAARAASMLEGWASDGHAGLPVGPRGSAVVANAVLIPLDEALEGLPFVRWVDDVVVGVRSDGAAREALERIDECLAAAGLARSDRKTRVACPRGFR